MHRAREMMFGRGGVYEYLECGSCGTLQLLNPPENPDGAYPQSYYTFDNPIRDPITASLKRLRARAALTGRGTVGLLMTRAFGVPLVVRWVQDWARYAGVTPSTSILDVGCGKAHIFPDLIGLGFRSLIGIDPYLEGDIDFGHGIKALRMGIEDVQTTFDFVMLHHSFEHMGDPDLALRHIHRVLAPEGTALIRIPIAGSYAWKTYGTDWVQLDAPRHLLIPSRAGMHILVNRAGFEIAAEVFDSDGFQFWGSEQYRRGMVLMDPRSHFVHPRRSEFSREQLREYDLRAGELNARGEGDSAGFYLKKKPDPPVAVVP